MILSVITAVALMSGCVKSKAPAKYTEDMEVTEFLAMKNEEYVLKITTEMYHPK